MSDTQAMEAEFDTVASWTEAVVGRLGPGYALPAACRGSASPGCLAWLAEALELRAGLRCLDAGSGLGGPAAWLAERYGVRPLLAEPMHGASAASVRMFGLPAVTAWSQALPLPDAAVEAVWCLGVLCTTTRKRELLTELRRVLTPAGGLGLLVFLRAHDDADRSRWPQGNEFPTEQELRADLEASGFTVVQTADAADLSDTPLAWRARIDRVEAELAARHATDAAFQDAQRQSGLIGGLLSEGQVRSILVHAVAT